MEHRKVNGNKAGGMERFFSELLSPKIDWRTVLDRLLAVQLCWA